MKHTQKGWVILSDNHPNSKEAIIVNSSFSATKSDAIEKFIAGTRQTWDYWKRKYKYRAARATQTLEIEP